MLLPQGYEDRTFQLGYSSQMEIAFKNKDGSVYDITWASDIKLVITNITNKITKVIPTPFSMPFAGGIITITYTMPEYDENDKFFDTNDDEPWGRGELLYAYSVTIVDKYSDLKFNFCVLRGLARLVRVAK